MEQSWHFSVVSIYVDIIRDGHLIADGGPEELIHGASVKNISGRRPLQRFDAVLICCLTTTACTQNSAGISLDDEATVLSSARGAEAAVVISPDALKTERRGALIFVGGQSSTSWVELDGLEHAEVTFDEQGVLGVPQRGELVAIGDRVTRMKRTLLFKDPGAFGTPLPMGHGGFLFYFNVGFGDASTGSLYAQTLEAIPAAPALPLRGSVSALGNCGTRIGTLTEVTRPSESGSWTAKAAVMDSTGSTPKTSRTVKLSTPLGKDVRMPCHEGVLHSVALDSSAKTSTTRAELFSLDTTSGELKGHEIPLPTAVSSNGPLGGGAQLAAQAIIDGQLTWVTMEGDLLSTQIATGKTRHIAHLPAIRLGKWWVPSFQDHRLAIWNTGEDGKGRLVVIDATTGKELESRPTPLVDEALRAMPEGAFVSGLALAPLKP